LHAYLHRDPARLKILYAYRRAQHRLRSYRASTQTVQEHAAQQPALAELAQIVDIAAYRPEPPDEALQSRAAAWKG
jgi:hypothetical protein